MLRVYRPTARNDIQVNTVCDVMFNNPHFYLLFKAICYIYIYIIIIIIITIIIISILTI